MKCEKIRELILTDYIDNQMKEEDDIRLNIHLANCRDCKEFLEAVKNTAVKPFANAKKMEAPGSLWERVKGAVIAEERRESNLVEGMLERLKSVIRMPRSAFAISTAMALVLIAVLTVTFKFNQQALEINREGQFEYSSYSAEAPASAFLNNDDGFGTLVEEYFL
jgi:predicted anti-sigma-YlaC factor YlaD